MAFDPYAPCPCGSGKKLKWCCQALAPEMERIERLRESGQLESAVRALDEVKQKHPGNSWAMTTRALLLLKLGRADEMADEVRAVLEAHPDNARAILLNALMDLSQRGPREAVCDVQEALKRAAHQSPSLAGSLATMMGVQLLREARPFSALQYLTLGVNLNPRDQNAAGLLRELLASPQIPLLYKEDYRMQPATLEPLQPDWAREFNEACELAARGAWQAAAEAFESLTDRAGTSKSLWFNLGICRAALGENERAADALRRYTPLEPNRDDAVGIEALAELLAPETGETLNRVAICYPVRRASALKQALESSDRFIAISAEPEDEDQQEEGPEVARYTLLDRPQPEYRPDIAFDELPLVQGSIRLRDPVDDEPELILETVEGDRAQAAQTALRETGADALGEPQEPEVIGEVSREGMEFHPNWVPPKGISPAGLGMLFHRVHKERIETTWVDLPQARFDGKSPREAASDPALHTRLSANILLLELEDRQSGFNDDWNPLREQLGLPVAEGIDPEECDVDEVPLSRMHRIETERLPDDDLLSLSSLAMACSATWAVERFCKEVTRRGSLKEKADVAGAYFTLAEIARDRGDRDRALTWIEEGRALDRSRSQTNRDHEWDLLEILTRLTEPKDEKLKSCIGDFFTKHRENAEACERLLHVLVSLGAIRAEDLQRPTAAPPEVAAPVASRPAIWTPGGERPAGEKVKIWTPGD